MRPISVATVPVGPDINMSKNVILALSLAFFSGFYLEVWLGSCLVILVLIMVGMGTFWVGAVWSWLDIQVWGNFLSCFA